MSAQPEGRTLRHITKGVLVLLLGLAAILAPVTDVKVLLNSSPYGDHAADLERSFRVLRNPATSG